MPKTITYRGEQIEVPFIGALHLRSIAAALRELMAETSLDGHAAITALQAQQYPVLIMMALDHVMAYLSDDLSLTKAERLLFGALGQLIGRVASDVATAPLDDLVALCSTVFEQEANTQAGKRLIHTLATFGQGLSPSTPSDEKPESPSDTTPNPETPTPETTGTATAG